MRLRFRIAANTLVQILGKLVSSSCTFLITILIARKFGVTGFGEFVKITTYVSLFYLIVDFGLNAVVLREIENEKVKYQRAKINDLSSNRHAEFNSASDLILKWFDFAHHLFELLESERPRSRRPEPQSRRPEPVDGQVQNDNKYKGSKTIFSNLLGLRVVFALVLIFLALAILGFLPFNPLTLEGFTPLSKLGIIILAPTILTQAIYTSCNAIFQKNLRYDLSVLASSLGNLGSLGLVYLMIKVNFALLPMIGSYLIGGLLVATISLYLCNFQLPIFNFQSIANFQFSIWKRLFFKSLPLGLTLIFNLIYFKADTLILTVFRPTSEVGIYGLARSFFEFPLAIPTFFMNAVYPVLLERKNKTTEQLKNLIKKSFLFLLLSSLVVMLLSFLFAPYITLIKSDFAPSVLIFRILLLYLPVFFLSSLFMWTIIALGEQRALIFIYGSVMLINILLNLIFIPRFGSLAAAWILGLSELIVLGMTGNFCLALLRKEAKDES